MATTTANMMDMETNDNQLILSEISNRLHELKIRGRWNMAVNEYAEELLENLEGLEIDDFLSPKIVERALLNGAENWQQFSEGGCSLVYDEDIAHRLCTPSELKRVQYREGGYRNPNSRENWIDCQARALRQAAQRILRIVCGDRVTKLVNQIMLAR